MASRKGAWAQVVFNLHPTFPNPTREVLHHPFELEEYGWGEFELSVVVSTFAKFAFIRTAQPSLLLCAAAWASSCAAGQLQEQVLGFWLRNAVAAQLHFADDAQELPVEIYHMLRLHPQSELEASEAGTKKPVLSSLRTSSESLPKSLSRPCMPSQHACIVSFSAPCARPASITCILTQELTYACVALCAQQHCMQQTIACRLQQGHEACDPCQVVNEQYEELVFSEPVMDFYERVSNYPPTPAQPVPAIAPHFKSF